jgi:hypothetical protein
MSRRHALVLLFASDDEVDVVHARPDVVVGAVNAVVVAAAAAGELFML